MNSGIVLTMDNFYCPSVLVDAVDSEYILNGIQSVHWSFSDKKGLATTVVNTVCSQVSIVGEAKISYYTGQLEDAKLVNKINAEVSIEYSWKDPQNCKIMMGNEILTHVHSLTIFAKSDERPQKWSIDITIYKP